ncbi:winged helix-turn-helix transcriptional regulator [Effusibacillus lacus]|uniref:Transcriptional regulator n=1 Tax=Effusibacillus lacus TaxID=1348429 RepID=A0A292YN25_9BACL|nr:helix-turn-helix domain-containing protein [Effusibacillus lacus]TCS68169.1 HxlR family transcriptional regulator [Effusibacillus lacus]GAX90299.1 transcriptional regulator [Effusibacillus lacus]
MNKKYNLPCNIANTLDLIGDRWTLLIIRELLNGTSKFNEIKTSLSGIAPNILSDRLQMLEQEGIVSSKLYRKHPPRYEYELTRKGKDLRHVLNALAIWGNRHLEPKYMKLVHTDCNHEVKIHYYCPNCDTTVKEVEYVPNSPRAANT